MSRVLHVARLSRLRDASQTGLDRQDESGARYAAVHGYKLVATAADADVSGSVSPWDRPALGPWLKDPDRVAQYDELVAAALDRLGRNARDLSRLRDWAEDNGKRVTVLSPALHWPPDDDDFASPIIWDVLGRLAEYELRTITKRYADTRSYLRRNNYLVGKPPWGFRAVPSGDHKTLAVDPVLEPVLREMVSRYLGGSTFQGLCDYLVAEHVPTKTGSVWAPTTVRQILRNPCLIGRQKDSNGRTVLRFDPVLDLATWTRLQATLDERARTRGGPAKDTAMLTGIVHCGVCQGKMYRVISGSKNHTMYYRCNTRGHTNLVRLDFLDEWVNDHILTSDMAGREVMERVLLPGDNHDLALEQNAADVAALDLDAEDYPEQYAALLAERARLKSLPAEPDRVEYRGTGITLAALWSSLDDQARRKHLLSAGYRVYATKTNISMTADDLTALLGFDLPGVELGDEPED